MYRDNIVNLYMKHNNDLSAFAPRDAPTEIIIEFSHVFLSTVYNHTAPHIASFLLPESKMFKSNSSKNYTKFT
jgi:hypothetical protein